MLADNRRRSAGHFVVSPQSHQFPRGFCRAERRNAFCQRRQRRCGVVHGDEGLVEGHCFEEWNAIHRVVGHDARGQVAECRRGIQHRSERLENMLARDAAVQRELHPVSASLRSQPRGDLRHHQREVVGIDAVCYLAQLPFCGVRLAKLQQQRIRRSTHLWSAIAARASFMARARSRSPTRVASAASN